ncbi:hypothetical protein ACUWEX_05035 [Okibacterium fritillariae]|uniref:hypothetical protein n=1 Tax=Okibacterium fritillariae TaxID=123320 RepID=UPI00405543B1
MSGTPALLHRGDALHGVDQYARTIADALGVPVELAPETDDGSAARHLHFTDRLWGVDAEDAAQRIERLAASGPVTVTLHDVPQPSDGERGFARRTASYRRVVAAASGVVCNSEHERRLLEQALGEAVVAHVIPLPAQPPAPRPNAWQPLDEVAVLGFFYPGKGHREVVDAVALLPEERRPGVVSLGGASPGHERELAELAEHAASLGVRFRSTGFLSVDDRDALVRAVAVPVIAHQHVSASGSLTDWISAGRRPLTIRSPYFAEMLQLRPGTLTLFDDGDPQVLAAAIAGLRFDPDATWVEPGTASSPTVSDTARSYAEWWAAL